MTGVDTCDRCGFDRDQWNEQDAKRTLDHAEQFFQEWTLDPRPRLVPKLDARRIDDQNVDVSPLHLAPSEEDGNLFGDTRYLGPPPDAGRIDQAIRNALVLEHRVDRVPSRAGDG